MQKLLNHENFTLPGPGGSVKKIVFLPTHAQRLALQDAEGSAAGRYGNQTFSPAKPSGVAFRPKRPSRRAPCRSEAPRLLSAPPSLGTAAEDDERG